MNAGGDQAWHQAWRGAQVPHQSVQPPSWWCRDQQPLSHQAASSVGLGPRDPHPCCFMLHLARRGGWNHCVCGGGGWVGRETACPQCPFWPLQLVPQGRCWAWAPPGCAVGWLLRLGPCIHAVGWVPQMAGEDCSPAAAGQLCPSCCGHLLLGRRDQAGSGRLLLGHGTGQPGLKQPCIAAAVPHPSRRCRVCCCGCVVSQDSR
jgi:hypothetical protein